MLADAKKKPCHSKLSTNKAKKRARYENVNIDASAKANCRSPSTKENYKQTAMKRTNVGKWENIFYGGETNGTGRQNKQTHDISSTKSLTDQKNLKGNSSKDPKKSSHAKKKNSEVDEFQTQKNPQSSSDETSSAIKIRSRELPGLFFDPDETLAYPIGPPGKSSTKLECTDNNSNEKTEVTIPNETVLDNFDLKNKSQTILDDPSVLDPDLTVRSPIGPPSKSSTPRGSSYGVEASQCTLACSPQQYSPSILSDEDIRSAILPEELSMKGQVPEEETQSPTIVMRSHCLTKTTIAVTSSPDQKTPKRKADDLSFDSLLGSGGSKSKQGKLDTTSVSESKIGLSREDARSKQLCKVKFTFHLNLYFSFSKASTSCRLLHSFFFMQEKGALLHVFFFFW